MFGIQTAGTATRDAIAAEPSETSSGFGYLITPLTITSASIITDTQNGVLQLSAPTGVTGTVTVTVTASDGTNAPVTQTFTVNIQPDTAGNPANPFAAVIPAAPSSVTLVPPAGSTNDITNFDNSSQSKELQFTVSGVAGGNKVEILADGNPIGQAIVASGATTVDVTTDGSTALADGPHAITAIQIALNQTVSVTESGGTTPTSQTADVPSLDASSAVQLTVDTVPPQFNFTQVTAAVVGVPYTCQVTTTDSAGQVTYGLTQEPTGMSIDSTTGVISWTPTSGQTPTQQITVEATDLAGNTVQQQFTINVLATNSAPVLASASPLMGTTDEDTTTTIGLASFLGSTISDPDTGAVIGGIAVTGTTGNGTWQYSLDNGTTFTAVGTLSGTTALLLPNNAELRYIPDGKNGETASITYRAWDTTGGASGITVDLAQAGLVGGAGPYSTDDRYGLTHRDQRQ